MNNIEQIMKVIKEYTEFVALQKSVYTDACAGFSNNKTVIESQVARVQRATQMGTDHNGNSVVMYSSMEDPGRPDVIIQRILRADDYISQNSSEGSHEQQLSKGIIVFIYHYWDDEIRYRLAQIKRVEKDKITSDLMGDLRVIRQAILHEKGILRATAHAKLKILNQIFKADEALLFTNEKIQSIFTLLDKDIARLMLKEVGPVPDGFDLENVKQIAIQQQRYE